MRIRGWIEANNHPGGSELVKAAMHRDPQHREASMVTIVCRIAIGLAVWVSTISPVGAKPPGNDREFAEDDTYRFGRQMFFENAGGDAGVSETSLALVFEFVPSFAAGTDGVGQSSTTGMSCEFPSDDHE
jgi:hypothetical protein